MYPYAGFEHLFPFAPFLLFPLLVAVALWTILIKGIALWHAARGSQKGWFIFLLIINFLGIPELIYLTWYRTDTKTKVAPAPVAAPAHESSAPEA